MGIRPLYEEDGDESTWSLSASAESGESTRRYLVGTGIGDNNAPSELTGVDIQDTINWLVGTTNVGVTDGRVNRVLPQFDPVFTSWPVAKVSGFRGVSGPHQGTPRPIIAGQGGSTISHVIAYFNGRCQVTFSPRPYPILSDAQIYPIPPPNGFVWLWNTSTGSQLPFVVYPEWWRFVPPPGVEVQNDYVTAQLGQMQLWRVDQTPPSGFVFGGMPRMFLPNDIVTFEFFAIPLRWLTSPNSYIRRLRGLVNQYPFYEGTSVGSYQFPAGSLLYLTYKQTTYSAVTQTPVPFNWAIGQAAVPGPFGGGALPAVAATPKLCNVTLIFLRTERYATNPPTPNNPNFIVHHHNAQPWLGGGSLAGGVPLPGGRLFYYTTSGGGPNGTPNFLSAPVPHLLFQDPDGPNAVQVPQTF